MKKENCPFCGHRWIRKSEESPIQCPNCHAKYYLRPPVPEVRRKKEDT